MTYFYAQLDGSNKVTSVCQLAAPLVAAYAIAIESMDSSLLGKTYNAGTGLFE